MDKGNAFWVGIDLHQSDLMLAAFRGWAKEPELYERLDPASPKVGRLVRKLHKEAPVHATYEASGCGYWLARRMRRWGVECDVAAPSLIPRRPGDRVKTDKRDALKLATLHRADLLTYVRVPGVEEERIRRVVRTREMIRRDVHRSKQRILKILLACGHVYEAKRKKWTKAFWTWFRALDLHPDEREALAPLQMELEVQEGLLADADRRIEERSLQAPYAGPVSRLRCLRGIDTLSAMVLCTEVCDMTRFRSASQFVGWLGLGVSEHTSVQRRQGGITRTGNSRCRRILVEAAWNNCNPPRISKELARRSQGQSQEICGHALRGQRRLYRTWRRLEPAKGSKKAAVAMARELAGFVWALWLNQPELLQTRD